MVTKRPIEITLVKENSGKWAEFSNGEKMFDMKLVQEKLFEENKDVEDFSEEPIRYHYDIDYIHM